VTVRIRRLGPGDVEVVLEAAHLFDNPPSRAWTDDFLRRPGHHLLLAEVGGMPAGFVTGIEIAHPDKGVEMLLYELGVDEPFRRRGIGRALVEALKATAASAGCSGVWVPVEQGNDVATALYLATGADAPEPGSTLWWSLQ
jgi:ribosomal protein S18 acetylase RimI-like enzyme